VWIVKDSEVGLKKLTFQLFVLHALSLAEYHEILSMPPRKGKN
jgi:hypothetical protein